MRVAGFLRWGLAAVALAVVACAPAATERCRRYDAVSLTPENHFAASVDWNERLAIDTAPERIDVALSVIRPVKGPIELVHVIGDLETDRWQLSLQDVNNNPVSVCWIQPQGGIFANCGAVLQVVPYYPDGHYYLLPRGNTVLEAGLAFYVCD